jgi:hypothetical protein
MSYDYEGLSHTALSPDHFVRQVVMLGVLISCVYNKIVH